MYVRRRFPSRRCWQVTRQRSGSSIDQHHVARCWSTIHCCSPAAKPTHQHDECRCWLGEDCHSWTALEQEATMFNTDTVSGIISRPSALLHSCLCTFCCGFSAVFTICPIFPSAWNFHRKKIKLKIITDHDSTIAAEMYQERNGGLTE